MTTRTAHYTTDDAHEVHLRYVPDYGKEAGKPTDVFYSTADYARKQGAHGKTIYPDPQPAR